MRNGFETARIQPLRDVFWGFRAFPQRLKPINILESLGGTAEAVPFQNKNFPYFRVHAIALD
jgi:hypothetical protein